MSAPRIAVIRQRYTDFGGAERFVQRALEGLEKQGAQVSLITRSWDVQAHEDAPQRQVLICDPFHIGRLWRDRAFAACACKTVRNGNFDLVQSHERLACCDIYRAGDGVHREWLKQKARVLTPAGRLAQRLSPFHRHLLNAEKAMFESPRLKAVICNSAMVRDEILANFQIAPERLHIIHNGVDSKHFSPANTSPLRATTRESLGLKDGELLLLFLGSGYQRKGLQQVLQAMNHLPKNYHLVVVGKDRREKGYREKSQQQEHHGRYHFIGAQSDVLPFYAAADAFVQPTLYDPFPNVVLEAMACSLPVITSVKSGAIDIIRDGKNGYIVDALDTQALVAHILRLEDTGLRNLMGLEARKTVQNMTTESTTQALLALYRQLLS